jgi:hypothetical protein
MVSRRQLELALGALWLLDGALQFQPFMFSKEFFQGILGMSNMGLPGPAARADFWLASVLVAHPAAWNAVFASLQVVLGLGLICRRTSRLALAASIPWALGVWVIGEGFGGLFMGGTSLVDGAPGAALLYAVLAVLAWPSHSSQSREFTGRLAWMVAWSGSALLELQTINHLPTVPAAQINNGRYGEPGWLASLNAAAGHLIGPRGTEFAMALEMTATLAGIGIWWTATRRAALTVGMVLAGFLGVLGQDLGAIATGHGTDPGTGPLLILLGLVMWPSAERTADARTPSPARATKKVAWLAIRPRDVGSIVPVGRHS